MLELANITPVHWTNSQLPKLSTSAESKQVSNIQIFEKEAETIFKKDVDKAKIIAKKKMQGSGRWLDTVLVKGTSGDKIAAMVVLIQEDPIHNIAHLKSLVDLLAKDRRTALDVLQIVKELFLSQLLIADRKLLKFNQQSFDSLKGLKTDLRNKYLKLWYFEDQLKKIYFEFIKHVERLSKDTVDSIRVKSTAILFTLLSGNPEQENYLLPCLINKIGDPCFKIASSSVHFLGKLAQIHPNMKLIIVKEVERLLYRSNVSPKAQYYAMCFLNGIILSQVDDELASFLISIYFSFFKAYIKRGEIDSKMLSALLIGVNRALPYAKTNKSDILKQTDVLYKLIRVSKFNTSIQALILMYQIITISDTEADRFYSALYQKLFDPDLQHSSKLNIFFSLIAKCLKADVNEKRIQAFVKRLLQICLCLPPSFACCGLLVISNLFEHRPQLKTTNNNYQEIDKKPMNENYFDNDNDDDDDNNDTSKGTTSSWFHLKNISYRLDSYNALHRNPMFCRADLEFFWELAELTRHYHPTVAIFAGKLLQGEKVIYSGDPLEDFNFSQFINRFISKNPKKSKEIKDEFNGLRRRKNMRLMNLKEGNILGDLPADNFLLKFNEEQQTEKKMKGKDNEGEDEESVQSISDSEFDEYLDKFEKGLDGGDINVKYKNLPKDNISDDESVLSNGSDGADDDNNLSDEEIDLGDLTGQFDSSGSEDNATDDELANQENNTDESDMEDEMPRKKRKKDNMVFADAEEYTDLIDENNRDEKPKNKRTINDKKQLHWEKKRSYKLNSRNNHSNKPNRRNKNSKSKNRKFK